MNAIRRLKAVWYPDAYHGWGKTRRYFEGWYVKIVSADRRHAFAFIPGISMAADGQSNCFIQVMDGVRCTAQYHRFPADAFRPVPGKFEVRIGTNLFSTGQMMLDLPDIQGQLQFQDTTPWPKMLGAPGIMGWYSFVPFMECNHGVVSLFHTLKGSLTIDGEKVDFTGGIGYMEKDWGTSFPKAYVWTQTNHFAQAEQASLLASVAHIPWLGNYFIGFIGGMLFDGRLYRFATYTGAKSYVTLDDPHVGIVFKGPKTELRIRARQAPGTALCSPISGEMTGKINESLQASVQVELLENGKRIFEGNANPAGLEVAGEVALLL
jgi:hypothetical protein